jgi:hypothetical protein
LGSFGLSNGGNGFGSSEPLSCAKATETTAGGAKANTKASAAMTTAINAREGIRIGRASIKPLYRT